MKTIQKTYRTDEELYSQAERILKAMGLTTSTAINMFLARVVSEEKFPFTPEVIHNPSRAEIQEKIVEYASKLPSKTIDFSNPADISEFFDE